MKTRVHLAPIRQAIGVVVGLTTFLFAGCSSAPKDTAASRAETIREVTGRVETTGDGTSTASNMESYRRDLAHRISEVNSIKIYPGRPQALLRSVIVVKYSIDAGGGLVRSEIVRTNRDRENETTALNSLKSTAPFPKPAGHLLRRGQVEMTETWLFNNDGRFQLRTIAQAQMSE